MRGPLANGYFCSQVVFFPEELVCEGGTLNETICRSGARTVRVGIWHAQGT